MEEFQKTYIWDEAFELTVKLNQVAEELPDQEDEFLSKHLRLSAIDVPTKLAEDFAEGDDPSQKHMVRVQVELELVRRIYPAIDTAPADDALDRLQARVNSDNWKEVPAPPKEEPEEAEEDEETEPAEAAETSETAPAAAPQVDSVSHSIAVEEG